MEFLIVILGIIIIVVGYFCFGIFVKFMLAWWMLAIGTPLLIVVAFFFGWLGAIIAIVGFIFLLLENDKWHSNEKYIAMEKKVDKAFNLSDT